MTHIFTNRETKVNNIHFFIDYHQKQKPIKGGGGNKNIDELKQELQIHEHQIPIEQLYKELRTDPILGLTSAQAKIHFDLEGPNQLTPPKQTPEWVIFVRNVFSYFGILLWAGALLCFLAYFIQSTAYEDPPEDNVSFGAT